MSKPEVPSWVSLHAPEAAAHLQSAMCRADTVVDPAICELARLRIAALLRNRAALGETSRAAGSVRLTDDKASAHDRWYSSPLFSEAERACLALAEQFVIDVSSLRDADVEHVLDALGPGGLYGFVQALYLMDMTQRLAMSLGAIESFAAPDLEATK